MSNDFHGMGMGLLARPFFDESERTKYALNLAQEIDLAKLPAAASLMEHFAGIDIKGQGQQGSCVGWTVATLCDLLAKMQGIVVRTSPAFAYVEARRLSGLDVNQDTGAYPNAGGDVLIHGVIPWSDMPYNQQIINPGVTDSHRQLALAYDFALKHEPITANDKVLWAKWALSERKPLMIGIAVFEEFEEVGRTGLMTKVTERGRIVGYHEIYGLAYMDIADPRHPGYPGVVLCGNHWSRSWGGNVTQHPEWQPGMFCIRYDAFERQVFDIRAVMLEQRIQPEPEPEPEPKPVVDMVRKQDVLAELDALRGRIAAL